MPCLSSPAHLFLICPDSVVPSVRVHRPRRKTLAAIFIAASSSRAQRSTQAQPQHSPRWQDAHQPQKWDLNAGASEAAPRSLAKSDPEELTYSQRQGATSESGVGSPSWSRRSRVPFAGASTGDQSGQSRREFGRESERRRRQRSRGTRVGSFGSIRCDGPVMTLRRILLLRRRSEDADVDQLDDSGFESSQESNSTHATDSEQEQFGTVDIPPPTGRKWRFSRRLDPIRQGASESVEELRQGTQVRAAKVQIPYPSNLPSSSPSSPTPTTPEHLYVWVLIDRSTVHLDAVRWSYDWQDEQARWDTMFEIMSFAKEEEEAKEKERKKKDKAKGKGKAKGKEK